MDPDGGKQADPLELSPELEPRQVLDLRVRAFRLGDFGLIYDSYHRDSFFCQHFPDRNEYIRYAWSHLRRDFRIRSCQVLRERRVSREEFHLIFHQAVEVSGEIVQSLEMARFYRTAAGWRYHSSQKLPVEDYSGKPEEIDFADFERLNDKVFF